MNIIKRIWGGGKSVKFHFQLSRASLSKRAEMLRPIFYHLGNHVELHTTYFGTEPYLISIEDDVCVASNVHFITHDVSCFRMANYLGIDKTEIDKVGCIILKENCFIGAFSILMPNVVVGKNAVIAAGSLVTKSVPDGEVWGGNPAKFIMKTDDYAHKLYEKSGQWPWTRIKDEISQEELIKMRQEYFFESYRK